MNFMNLNQSAHGDREFGFMATRLRLQRKIVVGYWQDAAVHAEMGCRIRAACAWHDARHLKIARFGDNMRECSRDRRQQTECRDPTVLCGERVRGG
jgi:L-arabinose isomerase